MVLTVNGRREPLLVRAWCSRRSSSTPSPPAGSSPTTATTASLWLPRAGLAAALDLEGAFNAVSLRLVPGASPRRRSSTGSTASSRPTAGSARTGATGQVSHRFVTTRSRQLRAMATGHPGHLPRRGGLPGRGLPHPARRGPACPDRHPQGARVRQPRHRRSTTRASRSSSPPWEPSSGSGLGHLFGAGMARMYRDFFRFPVLDYRRRRSARWRRAFVLALGTAAAGAAGAVRAGDPPARPPRPCGRRHRRRTASPSSSGSA